MVARLKRLDGTMCLGEKLRVRKINEETTQTQAQASAIAIQALLSLQGGNKLLQKGNEKEDTEPGENREGVNTSLKTLT